MKHSVMCEYGIAISVNPYNYSSNETITHLSYDRQMTEVISSKGIMFTLFAEQKPLNRCKQLPVPHKRLFNGTNKKDKQQTNRLIFPTIDKR